MSCQTCESSAYAAVGRARCGIPAHRRWCLVGHDAVEMDVEIGGRAETLDERDRAALGFDAFEPRLLLVFLRHVRFDLHRRLAIFLVDPDLFGRGFRQVDVPAFGVGAAVVNLYLH